MAKKFSDLRAKMPIESQDRIAIKAQQEIRKIYTQMPLQELRQARGLSQTLLAQNLGVGQPAIAKLEKRTDMYISTLRSHIRAMGGELDIIATFPDGSVRISNFNDLDEINVDENLTTAHA
mgnify:CR=1 FL=1